MIFWMLPPLAVCAALEVRRSKDVSWASSTTGRYDFDWQLSGDQAVAPLQVFDDGHQSCLQFPPPRPAVAGASSPLQHTSEPALLTATPDMPLTAPHASDGATNEVLVPTVSPVSADTASGASLTSRFHAGPSNDTLRAVLSRWAVAAGWTFQPQHWAVDVDIPLAGAAKFPADFKSAVRELLATTELADRPLQPCLCTDQVLRVVSLTQSCDRSAQRPGGLS